MEINERRGTAGMGTRLLRMSRTFSRQVFSRFLTAEISRSHVALLLPAVLLLTFAFVVPLSGMALRSIRGESGGTIAHYVKFFTAPVYLQVLLRTFVTAVAVTILTLLAAFPVSYVMSALGSRRARLLAMAVVIPFFTSLMVRNYAWIVLLGRKGIINDLLLRLGLIDEPMSLLYNSGAVLLGMTYVMLPYMILTLYSVMKGIDSSLVLAARGLGAGGLRAFREVFFPLTLPGIASGALLVFILSLGFFITPALMGGPGDVLLAMLIEHEIELMMNWEFGSAMAMILLMVTLLGFLLYYKLFGVERLLESKQ